jgi:hypothetical protein
VIFRNRIWFLSIIFTWVHCTNTENIMNFLQLFNISCELAYFFHPCVYTKVMPQ